MRRSLPLVVVLAACGVRTSLGVPEGVDGAATLEAGAGDASLEVDGGAFIQISPGSTHTCATLVDGAVQCWGRNHAGELGDGTTMDRLLPAAGVQTNEPSVGVATSMNDTGSSWAHSCALSIHGGVECWGANFFGELGDGTKSASTSPVAVAGLSAGVGAVALGEHHTCALLMSGELRCWGENGWGAVGDGTSLTWRPAPVKIAVGVRQVCTGREHTCALFSSGDLRCWGANWYGELGDGTTIERHAPTPVIGLDGTAKQISCGGLSCALLLSGAIECWGGNTHGELGRGTHDAQPHATPAHVAGLPGAAVAVAVGDMHACGLLADGTVYCWGDYQFGAVGNPSVTTDAPLPVHVPLLEPARSISSGGFGSCAVVRSGRVYCWGNNQYGQLGDSTTTNRNSPVAVIGLP